MCCSYRPCGPYRVMHTSLLDIVEGVPVVIILFKVHRKETEWGRGGEWDRRAEIEKRVSWPMGSGHKTDFYYVVPSWLFQAALKALFWWCLWSTTIKPGVWIMCTSYNEGANELTSVEISRGVVVVLVFNTRNANAGHTILTRCYCPTKRDVKKRRHYKSYFWYGL